MLACVRAEPVSRYDMSDDQERHHSQAPKIEPSNDWHRVLFEEAADGIFVADSDGRYIEVNRAACELLGYTRAELLERTINDIIAPDDLAENPVRYDALRRREVQRVERTLVHKDGSRIVVDLSGRMLADGRLLAVVRDITAQKRSAALLRASEDRYRSLIENSLDLIQSVATDGRMLFVNQSWLTSLGYTRDEVAAMTIWEVIAPDEQGRCREVFGRLSQGEALTHRTALLGKDGRRIELEGHVNPVREHGVVVAFQGFFRDVTDRSAAERSLARSERRFHALVSASSQIVWTTTSDGEVIEDSHSWRDFTGQTYSQWRGHGGFDAIHPADRERIAATWREIVRSREAGSLEYRLWHVSGAWRWVNVRAAPLINPDGELESWVGMITDVSESKHQQDLFRSQAHVLENISEGINYVDGHGILRYTNRAFDAMFGYERGELIGRHVSVLNNLGPGEDVKKADEIIGTVQRGGVWIGELQSRRKDGGGFFTRAKVQLLPLQSEAVMVTVQEDITEQRRAEEELRQAQKMESVGRLAGGVAHDFNNLLTAIQGYTSLMGETIPAGDPLQEDLQQVRLATDRASMLTRQLLAFSRKQLLAPAIIDVNGLVQKIQRLLERLLGEDIDLSVQLHPDLKPILADPGQIEQVLMNLAINARDAMPYGGTLRITTDHVPIDTADLRAHVRSKLDYCVRLTVVDSGSGMDEATLAKIFEPFFTTKPVGMGTGMGLATVYGIVKQSGGYVSVVSEPGRGATFCIFIPACECKPDAVGVAQRQQIVERASGVILLVEDDDLVRNLIRTSLEKVGYTVLAAGDGPEALMRAQSYPRAIDLLITDAVMPHMSGREVAERFRRQSPNIRVLYMSGYTDDTVMLHGIRTTDDDFLPKPFAPSALISKVRSML